MTSLTFTETVNAAPPIIFAALTQAGLLNRWLSNTNLVNASVGGNYYFNLGDGYYAVGEFTALEPDTRVAYAWHGKHFPDETLVTFTLTPEGDATKVTIEHSKIGEGEAWKQVTAQIKHGWKSSLEALKYTLEAGHDLRFMRRPMLGVYLGQLEPENAKRLNVPVDKGMLLQGVVAGLGAEQAGLQAEDVIVSMDGHPVGTYNEFNAVIPGFQAGQTIPVEYYRNGEKHTVEMTLSKREMPEAPDTVAALAEKFQEANATTLQELRDIIADVPEPILAQSPEPGEWSVNQVLAHLIFSERHTQFFFWALHGGDDHVPWPNNGVLHIAGLLAAYPTSDALLQQLAREFKATEGLVAALPEGVVGNKSLFAVMAANWNGALEHIRSHHDQIKRAIESARQTA